jgi:GAF domain-containing protein
MSFQTVVERLLVETGASRTTLRLDAPDAVFPVVAEALAPGVGSIAADTSIDLKASPTFVFLEREHRLLVQSDLRDAAVAAPPELVAQYGVRAQIVAPIVRDRRLKGIVSVHYAPGPREWTPDDVEAVERARDEIQAVL